MSRIKSTIEGRLARGQKCFVAYLTAGDPDLESTPFLVEALVNGGADIIELGIPFSDPLADGPVNQRAAERALDKGATLPKIIAMAKTVRSLCPDTPLVLFSYMNPIFAMGFPAFAEAARSVGIDGVLVVDLPPEESLEYRNVLHAHGLDTIFLASPTSDAARLALVDGCSSGFVYYVSRTGVTGVQGSISGSLQSEMQAVKKNVTKPVMVGFGVSDAVQAREISREGQGVVIGSAIVSLIEKSGDRGETIKVLRSFARSIRDGLDA